MGEEKLLTMPRKSYHALCGMLTAWVMLAGTSFAAPQGRRSLLWANRTVPSL
jgi:hypothetical protein